MVMKTPQRYDPHAAHHRPAPPPPGDIPPPKPGVPVGKAPHPKHMSWQEIEVEIEGAIGSFSPAFVIPAIIALILLVLFFLRHYLRKFVPCSNKNKLEGKTVIITGANTGIGKATAMELARRGGRMILLCRDSARAQATARLIMKKTKTSNCHGYKCDLANLNSIRDFVEEYSKNEEHVHILINNAAYMGPRKSTAENYEMTLGVNHLGHFYLSYLLIDKLKRCAPSRIINVVSDAYLKGKFDQSDLALKNYDIYKAYARSKLAQVLFNIECHRHFNGDCVFSYAVHPGPTTTDLLRNWPGLQGNLLRLFARFFFKPSEDGCHTIVYCAVADGLRNLSGRMFQDCKLVKFTDSVKDHKLGQLLWETSLHLVGLDHEKPVFEEGLSVSEEHRKVEEAAFGKKVPKADEKKTQ